jgi:hypothetical protein
MHPATLFSTQTPAGSSIDAAYTLGTMFTIDFAAQIVAVRYWKVDGTGVGFNRSVGVWDGSGTLIASGSYTEVSGDPSPGWVTVPLTTPVTLSTGVSYVAGFTLQSGMSYAFTSHFFDAVLDNAPLHAPIAAGLFNSGSSVLVYPTNSFNNSSYFADPVVALPLPPATVPGLPVPVMRASLY